MSLHSDLIGMKGGETREYSVQRGKAAATTVQVGYSSSQSHGDDGRPVRGAVVGHYSVTHEGRTRFFEHGPHAETEAARKRGANPNAKHFVAGHVADHIAGLA